MNMGFQKPHGIHLSPRHLPADVGQINYPLNTKRAGKIKILAWSAVVLGLGYFLTTASATTLLVLGGIGVCLIALATAACIYALDNSPFM
jgi:hypothetical protein